MNRILLSGAVTTVIMLLVGCNPGSSSDSAERESILVGRYLYSGNVESLSQYSADLSSAMSLARDHVNDNGGLQTDFDLEFADRNNDCGFNDDDNEQNREALSELVDSENVIAVLGPECSGTAQTVLTDITIPAGVVSISPATTRPELLHEDSAENLFFRTVLAENIVGDRLAQALIDDEDVNTIAVAGNSDDSPYLSALETAANNDDLTIIATKIFESNESDPAEFIEDLHGDSGNVDALVIFGFDIFGALPILAAAINGDEFDTIYVPDGLVTDNVLENDDYELSALSAKFHGVRGANGNEDARARFATLTEGTGLDPDGAFVANAYDAAFALALAIEKSGNQRRDSIAEALRSVVTGDDNSTIILPGQWSEAVTAIGNGDDIIFHGASGDLEFDDNGDVNSAAEVVTVSDSGEFERARLVE